MQGGQPGARSCSIAPSGSLVEAFGHWITLLVTGSLKRSPDTPVIDVLRQLGGLASTDRWTVTPLGKGAQSSVFAARIAEDASHRSTAIVVIKFYKSRVTQEQAQQQFQVLDDMHSVLNGRTFEGWNIVVPAPVFLCRSPLALVMTMAPGQSLLRHLEGGADESMRRMNSIARAVVAGIGAWWGLGRAHGDLNFDNILCDFESKTLSFLDAGSPMPCVVKAHGQRLLPSRELGYLLYEAVVTMRRSIRRIGAEARKQTFAKEILRAALHTIPSVAGRQHFMDEIQSCAQSHLMRLDVSATPSGLWRGILRIVGRYRIVSVLGALRTELGDCQIPERN